MLGKNFACFVQRAKATTALGKKKQTKIKQQQQTEKKLLTNICELCLYHGFSFVFFFSCDICLNRNKLI